jgi:hypothetical protein
MPKNLGQENPFDQPVDNKLIQFDQATFGALPGVPDSGRIVAKPTSIYAWRADLRQPRRAIPANVRGDWNGDGMAVPEVLAVWIGHVKRVLGVDVPMEKAVRGEWERPAEINDPEITAFIELLDLAASIYKEGLINPIRGAKGLIESGERRWLAYHLLNLFSGEDYTKIPTIEKTEVDVWAQAAENGTRSPLNAIGMARQLSLLIMAMYEGDKDTKFDRFDALVLPGGSDRPYYAQVANGDLYRIKRGMGERVLAVTGLKSMDYVRRYRALLTMPDALWVQADAQNWTERQIRDYIDAIKPSNDEVTHLHSVTGVTVSTPDGLTPNPSPSGEGSINDIPQTVERVRGVSGIYVDRPVQASPPAPLPRERGEKQTALVRADYDDDFDDIDEDEPDDWREPERSAGPRESMVPVVQSWGEGRSISTVLNMLKALVRGNDPRNDKLRALLIELATISPENIRQMQDGTADVFWRDYLNDAGSRLSGLIEEGVIGELLAYLQHLSELGYEIRERNR